LKIYVAEKITGLVVILIISVLTAACTTAPIDVDAMEEKSCAVPYCHASFYRRSGGMYDLAREARRKVDKAMQEREVWRNMQANELKSCPFCGNEDLDDLDVDRFPAPLRQYYYAGHCYACGAEGPHTDTEEEATELWNKRTEIPKTHRRGSL
jgi:Lar family restriction alleviation protein